MHSCFVATAKLHLIRKRQGSDQALTQVLLPPRAGRSREREQVAAVCYRIRKLKVEFLLVRTRKGRWTFPKGGVVPGLTHAQSAALEAFEEGGVHGRIEEISFTRYVLRKRGAQSAAEVAIDAYLCEVLRIGPPQEDNRAPTWFAPEKAVLRLKERRTPEDAGEFARVLARAMSRIQRIGNRNGNRSGTATDPLQRVHFEASDTAMGRLVARVDLIPYIRRQQGAAPHPPLIEFGADSPKILRLGPGRPVGRLPR